jgi:RNA polymerase sigma-70 factor (ECF subfamily)
MSGESICLSGACSVALCCNACGIPKPRASNQDFVRLKLRSDGLIDTDELLAERARAGERDAFASLVRAHSKAVFARLYATVRDVQRSEDLTQETFLRAWRKLSTLNDAARFRAWLDAIARSVLIDDIRRRSRERELTTPRSSGEASDQSGSSSPEVTAEQNERREQVLTALNDLPPKYREPLILRYIGGLDWGEIESELAMTNGVLRGLLRRGSAELRKRLIEQGITGP